jgi:hypothetical protein
VGSRFGQAFGRAPRFVRGVEQVEALPNAPLVGEVKFSGHLLRSIRSIECGRTKIITRMDRK